MPSRPDLRDIATNVKEAFADADKETLLDVLTFVVKEYVVEGPPPMLVHQAEQLTDLKGASFAQIISALQTRFDHPELAMFVVDGESVGVRIGGVVHPLLPARQPLAPAAPPQQFVDTRPPQPGVRVVETTLAQRPAASVVPPSPTPGPAAGPQAGTAPPPSRGLSVRGRPSGDDAAPSTPAPASNAPTQPTGPAPSAAPEKSDKPETGGDDASTRFGLLELD